MSGGRTAAPVRWHARLRPRSPRQELTLAVLLGVIGAGLIFLATRQGWAQVRSSPPRPLPASLTVVTGAALVPYADALALACLATLAAVLASRGLLRRLTGLLLALLGAILAASALSLSRAGAIAAANSGSTPAGSGAGSVTEGSSPASSAIPNVAGAASHVDFAAAGWQMLTVAGALLVVAAGILVLCRAGRMAVMSSRYDAPSGAAQRPEDPAAALQPASHAQASQPASSHPASSHPAGSRTAAGQVPAPAAPDSASIWEALSRGDDPTAAEPRPAST